MGKVVPDDDVEVEKVVRDDDVEEENAILLKRMSATPWLHVLVPLTILQMPRSKTRLHLCRKEKLTRNLGGRFPQVVAVLDLGTPMPIFFSSSKTYDDIL